MFFPNSPYTWANWMLLPFNSQKISYSANEVYHSGFLKTPAQNDLLSHFDPEVFPEQLRYKFGFNEIRINGFLQMLAVWVFSLGHCLTCRITALKRIALQMTVIYCINCSIVIQKSLKSRKWLELGSIQFKSLYLTVLSSIETLHTNTIQQGSSNMPDNVYFLTFCLSSKFPLLPNMRSRTEQMS